MCRWSSPDSVEGYDILGFEDHATLDDDAYLHSPDAITPAVLSKMVAIQPDDNEIMLEWCEECHVNLSECGKRLLFFSLLFSTTA